MTGTSFYRTPRISENIASIGYRRQGSNTFEPWNHRFYETDPDKGKLLELGASLSRCAYCPNT